MTPTSQPPAILVRATRADGKPSAADVGWWKTPVDHHLAYWDFHDRLKRDLNSKRVAWNGAALLRHATTTYGLDGSTASEWVERFVAGVGREADRPKRRLAKAIRHSARSPEGGKPMSYHQVRENIALEIRLGVCAPTRSDIATHIIKGASIDMADAREMADRIMSDLENGLARRDPRVDPGI
jgi:hypothetical protein